MFSSVDSINTRFFKIYLQIDGTMVLAIAALLYRELLRSSIYWFIFSCMIGFSIFSHWHPIDNHKFLLLYVTIILFCAYSASSDSQLKIIFGDARLFIIVLMGISVFWNTLFQRPLS